jgi:hypothetical protein
MSESDGLTDRLSQLPWLVKVSRTCDFQGSDVILVPVLQGLMPVKRSTVGANRFCHQISTLFEVNRMNLLKTAILVISLGSCTSFAPSALLGRQKHSYSTKIPAHQLCGPHRSLAVGPAVALRSRRCFGLRLDMGPIKDDDMNMDLDEDTLEGSVLAGKKMSRFHHGMTDAQLKIEKKLGERLLEAVIENDMDSVRQLCGVGEAGVTADPDYSDEYGFSCMMVAAKVRHRGHVCVRTTRPFLCSCV